MDTAEPTPATASRHQDDAQLQALFDVMPQLGWAAHPDGWIYYYNRQWYEYCGATPESMAGWGWQSVHNPELLPLVLKRWKHSIATEQPFEMAFQLRRHDGVFRWFLTRVCPQRDAHGTLTRWVGINTDIDDQKKAEETAAAANRAKDEFLAVLGHELRNPLAPIVTALKLMELKAGDVFQYERTLIARHTEHLSRLVDDLLDVSRFMRGNLDIRAGAVDVQQVITEACEMVSPLVERKKHTLHLHVPDGVTIYGDAARIRQVAVNLLTNAAKYTSPGGHIRVTVAVVDGTLQLSVQDTGVGIAASMVPSLFMPFVQQSQAIARSDGGLGLGLAIVKSIVTAHGGTVEAHSAGEGQGSEFIVRIPVASPDANSVATAVAALPRTERSRRILIVDDNTDAADTLAAVLERFGHVVHVEYDAPTALSAAEVFGPEVAVLDLGLPDLDGYELARRLRRHPRLSDVQIIAVTGYGQPSDRTQTRKAGFDHHFTKPVQFDALLAAIELNNAQS